MTSAAVGSLLVIGFGNPLRGDDAVGPMVAESVAARAIPGVQVVICHQLVPELAPEIATKDAVIFVDATVEPQAALAAERQIEPTAAATIPDVHSTSPAGLLAMAHSLYGKCPPAWCVTVRGTAFEFGTSLSPAASRGVADAVEIIARRVHKLRDQETGTG